MRQPLIGILPQYDMERKRWFLCEEYQRAVFRAGGLPVLIFADTSASQKCLFEKMDGFLFPGGPDVHPLVFGEDVQEGCGSICVLRDQMELSMLQLLAEKKKPVLGICRGIQVMNIAFGGDIYQHLDEENWQMHNQRAANDVVTHQVQIAEDSLLYGLTLRKKIFVNSFHHQGLRNIAKGFRVSAQSRDGLPEALEKNGHPFFLGVQWHPEHLWHERTEAAALFQGLIQNC